ncbi:MAG: helix-turn-helix domain-containing protein [Candidatus Ornithomonoglobus sp.]
MPIYEAFNLNSDDSYSIYATSDLAWDAHFHRAIECIIALSGEIICTVNSKEYLLKKDDALLIMPNQIHSYKTEKHSRIQLVRFSPGLAGTFMQQYERFIPADNRFKLLHQLNYYSKGLVQPQNLYELKGLIYTLLGDFCTACTEWLPISSEKNIIYRLIMYIEEHFREDCFLKDAADALSYNYTYVSKEFLRTTGLTFVEYLNNCRINYACHLLGATDLPITRIAEECGYSTIRTFNRNFLKYTQTTPVKYLKENKKSIRRD